MRTIPIAILLATLLLALPAGAAQWRSAGSSEPDNAEDDPRFIWTGPPGAVKDRIYFNGFTANSVGIVSLGLNINAAAVGSRMQPTGIETYIALLGNWVDCNGDGYIGLHDSGLREYDAALLPEGSPCPAHTGDPNEWTLGAHNYNGWVTELIPVGTDGGQPSAGPQFSPEPQDNGFDLRVIRDTTARVWGDLGLPDDIIEADDTDAGTCPIAPFPRGTLKDTGGVLDYLDCHLGDAGPMDLWNGAMEAIADPAELRFADEDDGRSGPLGRIDTLGSEDSSNAAFTATDCSEPEIFNSTITLRQLNDQLGRPIGDGDREIIEESFEVALHPPAPATRDTTSPNAPGQLNATSEEFGGNCDTSDDAGGDTYGLVERDFEPIVAGQKRQALFNMEYEDNGVLNNTPRGGVALGLFDFADLVRRVDFPTHGGSAGMSVNNARLTHDWFARVASVKGPPTRTALAPDAPIPPADFVTYYAFVGGAVTSSGFVTPGATGQYGSAQCGSFTTGLRNGWDCDASAWYRNNDGTPQAETQGGLARPGASYNLRDVDCEDGGTAIGIPLGPAALGERPCAAFG